MVEREDSRLVRGRQLIQRIGISNDSATRNLPTTFFLLAWWIPRLTKNGVSAGSDVTS